MRKVWIICAVVVSFAGGLALPTLAQEQVIVAGEWSGQYTGLGGERLVFYLNLKQEGEKVTGTYSNPSGGGRATTDAPISGTLKDGVLVLTKGPQGFKATVTGNTMSGTFLARAGSPLTFTAQRTK